MKLSIHNILNHEPLPAPPIIFPEEGYFGEGKEKTLELLKKVPDVNIYGFLLTMDVKHPVSQMVSERWYELHDLTGPNFLLLAFNPPSEWKDSFKDYWKEKLGKEFEDVWAE